MAPVQTEETMTEAVAAGAEAVQALANLTGLLDEVTGIDAHTAELRAGKLDRRGQCLLDVVGVQEQSRIGSQRLQLCGEGLSLGIVEESE